MNSEFTEEFYIKTIRSLKRPLIASKKPFNTDHRWHVSLVNFSNKLIYIYPIPFQLTIYSLFNFVFSAFVYRMTVAYLNMGTSLIALGRCDEAAQIFRKGSNMDGRGLRDRTAHDNARLSMLIQLGSLYAEQGKLQRAVSTYREALYTKPKHYPAQVNIRML